MTHLYRFFDDEGQLLYVGITTNPASRFSQHRQEKPWDQIRRIELETFPTRDDAATAERVAIQTEKPTWNVVHAGVRPPVKPIGAVSGGLTGHFFHSFTAEPDGCRLVHWQGVILEQLEPGFYLVQTFDWFVGSPWDRRVVSLEDMREWAFYEDEQQWRDVYETSLSSRSERHFRHKS